jgi:hypothetical protein
MRDLTAWRYIVGGDAFLHRRTLAWMVPPLLVASLMSRDIASVADGVGWTLANVGAFIVCWLLIVIADRSVFRHKQVRAVPVVAVVLFGSVVGAVKGFSTDYFGALIGLETLAMSPTVWRSVGTAIVGAVGLAALAAVRVAIESYNQEHQLLVAQLIQNVVRESADSPAALDLFVAKAKDALKDVSPAQAVDTIVGLIDAHVRPFTHALWQGASAAPKRLTVTEVFRIALLRNPLPAWPLGVVYGASVWPLSSEMAGVVLGSVRAVIAGLTLSATLVLARRLRPLGRSALLAGMHLAVTVLAATVIQMGQYNYLFGGLEEPATGGLWLRAGVWVGSLVLIGGAVAVAVRAPAVVRQAVLHAVGPEALKALATKDYDQLFAQRVATKLHADLQGQMLAAANRIELNGNDPDVLAVELAHLDAALSALPIDDHGASDTTFVAQLDALIQRWHGFVAVTIVGAEQIALADASLQDRAVQVVSEGIVNAVRHGLAGVVAVSLTNHTLGVTVVVQDDGIGLRAGPRGLGSTFFASVSKGNWSLRDSPDGGALLTVHVTC